MSRVELQSEKRQAICLVAYSNTLLHFRTLRCLEKESVAWIFAEENFSPLNVFNGSWNVGWLLKQQAPFERDGSSFLPPSHHDGCLRFHQS
ncbi:hypothetical protein V6N13_029218 [Hibiscus sabdariffa]|uniref:Uncharacterized protein n=1 Tax=Hibiscus sabdariffa TaxID=183260 RepID=A0ABR2TBH9_9ROSI